MNGSPPFIDTNVFLRLLLADHAEHSPAAYDYFRGLPADGSGGAVLPSTLSEVVFVLTGPRHQLPRHDVAEALERLLALPIEVVDRDEIELAVDNYRSSHDDWDDCLLTAYSLLRSAGHVVSFDQDLENIPGVSRYSPLSPSNG